MPGFYIINTMANVSLADLEGKKLDGCLLRIGWIKELHSGWCEFKLLCDEVIVIEGIYSMGGKGVKPWFDVSYRKLKDDGSALNLFKYLGDIIPQGGHIMVSYEGEQKIHKNTLKSLNMGVPAAITPLGFLIFQAGFQYVKDWYFAEGGYEGPRKLWGEKAPDKEQAQIFLKKTADEISQFLSKKTDLSKTLENESRKLAELIMRQCKK